MKRNDEIVVQTYLRDLSAALICSRSVKKAFLSDIKYRIAELKSVNAILTAEELYREFGSPSEIANGFEKREDIKILKSRIKRRNMFCLIMSSLAVLILVVLVIVLLSDDDYYTTEKFW